MTDGGRRKRKDNPNYQMHEQKSQKKEYYVTQSMIIKNEGYITSGKMYVFKTVRSHRSETDFIVTREGYSNGYNMKQGREYLSISRKLYIRKDMSYSQKIKPVQ